MTVTPATATVLDHFARQAERRGGAVALHALAAGGATRDERLTWREWADASREVAAAFVAAGHAAGEVVTILAGNRMLWPVADVGALRAGLVSAGVYPTSAAEQVEQLLADCGATAVIVDTREQLAKVERVRAALPALRTVVCAELDAPVDGVQRWDDFRAAGRDALAREAVKSELARRADAIAPETVAVLIYTSGSTGEPKGACITHRYLLSSAESIRETFGFTDADSSLAFLPYSHAAERVFGLYTRIVCGMRAGLVEDVTLIRDAARTFEPTIFGGLPRSYEKAYDAVVAARDAAVGADAERWRVLLSLGAERSRLRRAGHAVPESLEREWRAASAPAAACLATQFGGRLRIATSGGAVLPPHVAELLDAAGLTVLGGYGQTEHLCLAFHRAERYDFESVGIAMPGTQLRIAEDGEVLVRRGALTFAGYLHREAETREAFTADGEWLRTGDLGVLDARGSLRIVGRRKELIALSTGKKVSPLPIEARLAEDPLVAHAVLFGEGRGHVTALLCLKREAVEAWADARGLSLPWAELVAHDALQARVDESMRRVNATLSRPEQVRRYALLDRELTVADGELTPTLKVRRGVVAERHAARLEALYR